MNNKLLSASVLGFGLIVSSFIITNGVFAQAPSDSVRFPIAELGNCKDKDACKTYCDDASHADACLAFAEKNGLMSEDEIDTAKKFIEAGGKGPGGCTGKDKCQAYCDDISHIDACVAFAEKTGILPPEELAEAKQVQAAIAKGVKPPACRNKKECDAYCEEPSHMKECIAFGEAAGFLQGRELEDAKKMLTAIDNGAVPPPCRGKDSCDAYCSEPEHMEACMTFAQAAGFMTEEEAQNSQKMLAAIKKGVKPPACRGKEECDIYCTEPAHADECINFAIAAGFMNEKEAEMAKKTGGKGPGGCVGKDACDAFCGNPENQQTCIDFGRENGMISEEEAERMQEGQKKFKESMQNIPSEVEGCLKTALGDDAFEKMKRGQAMPSRDAGEKMGSCFSQMRQQGPPPGGGPEQGRMPPEGRQGWGEGQRPPEGEGPPGGQQEWGERQWSPEGGPMMPPEGQEWQRPPGEQFAPGTYPGPMPPEGERAPDGQFIPGTYPSQPPPDGAPGAYLNQQTPQYVPGAESVMPPPEGSGGGEGGGIAPTEAIPPTQPIESPPPVEQTAPQSSVFDLKSSLAAVASFFGVSF